MATDGSYFKAKLIVAERSHIKQLAAIGERDVEPDLIAYRSALFKYLCTWLPILPLNYFRVPEADHNMVIHHSSGLH